MKMNRTHKLYQTAFLVLLLIGSLLLAACGIVELGIATVEPDIDTGTSSAGQPLFDEPGFAIPVGASFEERIELVGYTVEPAAPEPGSTATMVLIWRTMTDISKDYQSFVHLLDANGQLVSQSDHPPGASNRPTSSWQSGEYVIDRHQLSLPAGVSFKELAIQAGLYDSAEGLRLDLDSPNVVVLRDAPAVESATDDEVSTDVEGSTDDQTPEATAEPERPTPEPTPTVETPAASTPLRVVYTKGGDAWLWDAESDPKGLAGGDVEQVVISDDGQRVAFRRGSGIWAVDADGGQERQLVTVTDFGGLDLGDLEFINITPGQMEFLPGSHLLFFNTVPQLHGPGLILSNDLWMVDADAGEPVMLLPPGQGGRFTISPDGQRIALIRPGRIDLMEVDGGTPQEAFTHTRVITYSEFEYYADPVWAPDSQSLMVAIPPPDGLPTSQEPTSIWSIPVDGRPANFVATLDGLPGLGASPRFSPDLGQLAFLFGEAASTQPGGPPPGLAVAEIQEFGLGPETLYPDSAQVLYDWSPDNRHFAYAADNEGTIGLRLGALGEQPQVVGNSEAPAVSLRWVDESHYLYLQRVEAGWELRLGQVGSPDTILVDMIPGSPGDYDFTGSLEVIPSQ